MLPYLQAIRHAEVTMPIKNPHQVETTDHLSLLKTRFERIDGVVRQGLDTRQCLRIARLAVCRARPSRASPRLIVIGSVFRKDSSKVLDVEHEQMIRAVLPPIVSMVSIDRGGDDDHPTRGAGAMASRGLSPLLALEVSEAGRPAINRCGSAGIDPADEH